MLLEQLVRLVARAVGLLDRLPDPLPPLVDRLLDRRRTRYRFRHEQVIRKQTIVQIISPGVTWISGFEASEHQTRT